MRQVYIKSPIFVWEIFPRILGKRPKGILKRWSRITACVRKRKKTKHWKVDYGFLKQNENISDRRYLL